MESLNVIENVDCFVSGIITPYVGSGNRSAALREPEGLERVVSIRNLTLFEHCGIVLQQENSWFSSLTKIDPLIFLPRTHDMPICNGGNVLRWYVHVSSCNGVITQPGYYTTSSLCSGEVKNGKSVSPMRNQSMKTFIVTGITVCENAMIILNFSL